MIAVWRQQHNTVNTDVGDCTAAKVRTFTSDCGLSEETPFLG